MSSKSSSEDQPLCFIIGPIGKEGADIRKHADMMLNAVFKEVAGSEEFKYRVKRADEDADPGTIGDRVISDILHAELVIADLTDLNPNAFYELGIRHATSKATIHVARLGTVLPFDNISQRTIFIDLADWHSIESGRTRLAQAIRAVRDPGFRVSNPVTQANASYKMRESSDSRDQVIMQLRDRVDRVEVQLSASDEISSRRSPSAFRSVGRPIAYIQTRALIKRGNRTIRLAVDQPSFGDFLDELWHALNDLDTDIRPYAYGVQWLLEDAQGKAISSTRDRDHLDSRTLEEVGIYAGGTYRVIPVEPEGAKAER